MIVVTGGAGFIGSNLVHGLNAKGRDDIVVVDNLTDGRKFLNIRDARIFDYLDQAQFLDWLLENGDERVDAVFHLGACSDTTEWDGRYVMENNYAYSKQALNLCLAYRIPFIYASSAAVYGGDTDFRERIGDERPLNVYGYSKALFDQYVTRRLPDAESQVSGLRYFNVYGPREQHKGSMASVAWHHRRQLETGSRLKLFEGCDGYDDGEQRRDFVHVDDAVSVKLWLLDHPTVSGVFNCGTGHAEPFNHIADGITGYFGEGEVEYISFPDHLEGRYQSFTEADTSKLREAGYEGEFRDVRTGVKDYMAWLDSDSADKVIR